MREREGSIARKAPRAPGRDAGSTPAASTRGERDARQVGLAMERPGPDPSLIDAAERYLSGRRCVLWADRTIDRPEERRAAAEWLAAQVVGVLVEKASPTGWSDLGLVGGR